MVYRRQHIPGMEEERFCIVDPGQSYVSPAPSVHLFVFVDFFPRFRSGDGENYPLVRDFSSDS